MNTNEITVEPVIGRSGAVVAYVAHAPVSTITRSAAAESTGWCLTESDARERMASWLAGANVSSAPRGIASYVEMLACDVWLAAHTPKDMGRRVGLVKAALLAGPNTEAWLAAGPVVAETYPAMRGSFAPAAWIRRGA